MKIAVIAGDGIGPEVINESLKVLDAACEKANIPYEVDMLPYCADYYLNEGITIEDEVLSGIPQKYSAVLLGALGDQRVNTNVHAKDILLGMRQKLDLYVNFRPIKLLCKRYCPLKSITDESIDFAVFRENTEDLYLGIGGTFKEGMEDEVAVETSMHTKKGVTRIIREAFEYAKQNKLSNVVMCDKGNAMRYAGDLWKRAFDEVSHEYPDVEKEHIYIDALQAEVLSNPSRFKVIVTSNVFGDILTDMCAVLQGGMGMAASVNYNPASGLFKGLFEPVHGSAPDIATKNIANPIAAILCSSLIMKAQGHQWASDKILNAVQNALENGFVTPDLKGNYSTSEVGDKICEYILRAF